MERSSDAVVPATLDAAAVGALVDLLGGDRDALAELAAVFAAEVPDRIAEMRAAGAQSTDAALARRAGHTLKSNALTFGALELGASAHRVEIAGSVGDLDEVARLVPEVESAWLAVKPAVLRLGEGNADER